MKRQKIDYGIDLGTTNSSICRMDNGVPTIMRTDTLREVMPSCVSFTRKKGVKVGEGAYNDMKQDKRRSTRLWKASSSNTYVEFKRTMGTDTAYYSSNMERSFSSEELSAEVIKRLKSFVADDTPQSIVVTVPAKFTVNQKTATIEAAKMAGFHHCELLQEPIAAAMAYGLGEGQKDGYWMVFDFGGGTFDAALLRVEEGILQVVDTEGDNYLGGKNLDYAIVDKLLIPHLGENFAIAGILADPEKKVVLRDALKTYAEEVKIQLSTKESEDVLTDLGDLGDDDDGEEMEIDFTITRLQAEKVMRPYLQKAVDICLEILNRNRLVGNQLDKVLLVGGPTMLPIVRRMIQEQVTQNIDTSINPMTAVAVGAALYASTIDMPEQEQENENEQLVKFDLNYEPTTVELVDWVSLKLISQHKDVSVEIVRGDNAWASGRVNVDGKGRVVEVQLLEKKPNLYNIIAYDSRGNSMPCSPGQFVIIQGTRVGNAVLPYNIGISVWDEAKQDGVFQPFIGLEKNKMLPAVGVIRGKSISAQLRPGVSTDKVTIPIYQADAYQTKTRAYLYEWVADVLVSGDDVNEYVPKGATAEVTLKVDTSEQMTMEVYIQAVDLTIERKLDTSKKQSVEEAVRRIEEDLKIARKRILQLQGDNEVLRQIQTMFNMVEEEAVNSTEKKAVLQHLKELLRKMEEYDQSTEWKRVYDSLKRQSLELSVLHGLYGAADSDMQVDNLKKQVDALEHKPDMRTAALLAGFIKETMKKLKGRKDEIEWIHYFQSDFDNFKWKDKVRAKELVAMAVAKVDRNTSTSELAFYANTLYGMVNWPRRQFSSSSNTSSAHDIKESVADVKNKDHLLE